MTAQQLEKIYRVPVEDLSDNGEVKVKKWKTFEEICPVWIHKVRTNVVLYDIMCILDCKYCFVGEAHGWDSAYVRSCKECSKYSGEFVGIFIRATPNGFYSGDQETINTFVNHFNEVHNK